MQHDLMWYWSGLQDCLHLAALTALTILKSVLSNSGVISLSMPFVRARVITGFTVLLSSTTEQSRFEDVPFSVQDLAGSESSDGIKIDTSSLIRHASSCPVSIVPVSEPSTTAVDFESFFCSV